MAKRKIKLGLVEKENLTQIKHGDKVWACNLHRSNSHNRIYCKRKKAGELRGCKGDERMHLVSFYSPGKALAGENDYFVDFCCYGRERKPTRCFNGNIPADDLFALFLPYLREIPKEKL